MSLAVFLEEFTALVNTIKHYRGCIRYDTALINYETMATTLNAKKKGAHDKLLAMDFLKKAPCSRFGNLLTDLDNLYSRGVDQYPKNLVEAHALLVNYQPPRSHVPKPPPDKTDGIPGNGSELFFAQLGTPVPGTDGNTHPNIQCFACKNKGHYANMCPKEDEVQFFQSTVNDDSTAGQETDFTFTSVVGSREMTIPKTWVLLDSQSTVSVFCNAKLLQNIRPCTILLVVLTNGGHQVSTQVGEVHNLGTVWYNPQSLANILLLAEVHCRYRITMDTVLEASICVHRSDRSIMKFREYKSGLYYHDTITTQPKPSSECINGYSFIVTIAGNKDHFHCREIKVADCACALYAMIGRASQQQFEHILNNNLITNCPVTIDDVRWAIIIYGLDVPAIKGKSVRGDAISVPTQVPSSIPSPILDDHSNITLCADFFFVQGLPFFHTISWKLKFHMVTPVKNLK